MFELKSFQREALEVFGINRRVICNWSKGLGKTFFIASTILIKCPTKVLFCSKNQTQGLRCLYEKFQKIIPLINEEWKKANISITNCVLKSNKIEITYSHGSIITIYDYDSFNGDSNTFINYIIFDDILPIKHNYEMVRNTLSMVSMKNDDKELQKFDNDFTILSEDYRTGIKNGLISQDYIDEIKPVSWFSEYDIFGDKNEDVSFSEGILNVLENELDCLTPKIKKARIEGDYGTYKNLILAYKEILNLHNINNSIKRG